MATRDDLQFIDLSDFKAGIATNRQSIIGDIPGPDGAAQEAGTWGCYALPDGGLAPMPAISFDRQGGDPALPDDFDGFEWPTEAQGYPAGYDRRIAVLDAHVVSPVETIRALNESVTDLASFPAVDLFTARQFWMREIESPHQTLMVHRFRGHPVYSGNTSNTYAFKDLYSTDVNGSVRVHSSRWTYGWGSIMGTRTQAESPDVDEDNGVAASIIGPPVVVCGLGGMVHVADLDDEDDEGEDTGQYLSYPDYHEGDTSEPIDPHAVLHDAVYIIPSPLSVAFPGQVFGHQGRLCAIARKSGYKGARRDFYHGNHDGFRAASEILQYWPTNGIYNNPNGPARAVYLEEATTGYGVVHSVNANSLLLIKNVGGAVQVTGDISRPQVTRLPGIPAIGGLANRGVVTDKGFVYGTASGVWMWTGSDSATLLSPSLAPDFWVPSDVTTPRRELEQLVGSFAYQYPFVFAPNNWVMDLQTGGWFRYHPTPDQDPDDGTIFAFNNVDHDGNLWAVVASYEIDTRFFAQFDQTTAVSKWSWQSQPIVKARARYLNFRSLSVLAAGIGRITVTVHSADAKVTDQIATFDLTEESTQLYSQSIGMVGIDVEVTITSEAHTPGEPAPTLHRLSIGYTEAQQVGTGTR